MRGKKLLLTMAASLLFVACADNESPSLRRSYDEQRQEQATLRQDLEVLGLNQVFNPRLDIVFEIDNSRSNKKDINTLKANALKLANGLARNPVLDVHIAAVTVFDSKRFTNSKDGVYKVDPTDGKTILYLEKGELIPLKDANGNRMWDAPRYVTRENLSQLPTLFDVKKYEDTDRSDYELLVGYESKNITNIVDGKKVVVKPAYGPNDEEALSPIKAVFDVNNQSAIVKKANKGFVRGNGSMAVVIPITDADSSDFKLSVTEVLNTIYSNQYSDVMVVGLLCEPTDKECRNKYPGEKPTKLEGESLKIRKFIAAAQKRTLKNGGSVTSAIPSELRIGSDTWGEKLVKIGDAIRRRVSERTIELKDDRPLFDVENTGLPMIEVFYGDKIVNANDAENGWVYNAINNTLKISGNVADDAKEASSMKIKVNFNKFVPGEDSQYYMGLAEK